MRGGRQRRPLRVRVLGRVQYRDALALQHALFRRSDEDYLLLLEHPPVYTLGVRAKQEHLLSDPGSVGAEVFKVDRGGDVTYHGPGQLVGYPIVAVEYSSGAVPAYVRGVEQLVIDALFDLGLQDVGRVDGLPGVWVEPGSGEPRKICAVGVRVSKGRTMHGFALNVAPDLAMFGHIIPCGIPGRPVTSLVAEGLEVPMDEVIEAVIGRATRAPIFAAGATTRTIERQSATGAPTGTGTTAARVEQRPLYRRLDAAGVDRSVAVEFRARKPAWMRVDAEMGAPYLALRKTMRSLDLATVCEEAGCPNIYECWADGTATFMINGSRCTRACGFCLVDTRHPLPLDADEPNRVAEAVAKMALSHAVVTAVARDDLDDGGAAAFAATIAAVRSRSPKTAIEVLVPDCKGESAALRVLFDARPDVFNHNLETVLRLQRAVRPSASYARSLAVLAAARAAGLVTKSGLIVGMGESVDEVEGTLADLAAVGVSIVTIGQYLRPTKDHLPVVRWWSPDEFQALKVRAERFGFAHVEASPLTRSSYHARQAAQSATPLSISA